MLWESDDLTPSSWAPRTGMESHDPDLSPPLEWSSINAEHEHWGGKPVTILIFGTLFASCPSLPVLSCSRIQYTQEASFKFGRQSRGIEFLKVFRTNGQVFFIWEVFFIWRFFLFAASHGTWRQGLELYIRF